MARQVAIVPDETSLLCEGCGYVLDGLPAGDRCPECGKPTVESIGPEVRRPAAWEEAGGGRGTVRRFLATSAEVLFHPDRFYRTTVTRGLSSAVRNFARIYWGVSSILLASAASIHLQWYAWLAGAMYNTSVLRWTLLAGAAYVSFWATTLLAAKLSAWEARYRGYRLPEPVVLRGLYYHAVHYLPVSLIGLATVAGYSLSCRYGLLTRAADSWYLYLLCFEVVASAAYLFVTYWTAMRNMMYANR